MVDISICPNKYAILVLWLIVYKFTHIDISINILKSISIFAVILKISFVKSNVRSFVDEQPIPMVKLVTNRTEIDTWYTFIKEYLSELL